MTAKIENRIFELLLLFSFALLSAAGAQQPADTRSAADSGLPRAGVNGVEPPRCIACPPPDFTKKARKANIGGTVLLDVTVTTDGKIIRPVVLKTSGFGLEEKAVAQVQKWKMKPCYRDGQPVGCRVQIETTFHRY